MMSPQPGYVYFVQVLVAVKVGFSKHPPHLRVGASKSYCPWTPHLLGYVGSDRANILEKELHIRLYSERTQAQGGTEWFRLTQRTRELLSEYNVAIQREPIEEMNRNVELMERLLVDRS